MGYLGVAEAVIARLQGKPKTFVPELPKLPEHIVTGSAELDTQFRPNAHVDIAGVEVPIYFIDPSGRELKSLFPSFTCNVISFKPRFTEFVFDSKAYKGDYAREYIPHTQVDVEDVDEEGNPETRKGPIMLKQRAVMHPYDVMFEIRALCDDDTLSAFMVEHVYANVFEPRDFIRVPLRDGTYRSWDVIFQNYSDLDSRQAVRAGVPGIERQYTKVFTYLVEGYLDNTERAELVNAVRSRRLNLSLG